MSTVTSPASVDRDLAAIVGEGNVKRTDFEINGVVPAAVVYPGSADEVGAILHLANARDLVVAPAGGLTKQQIGCVPERIDILLSTTRLNKVEEYDPGDLTIAVQAGMPFAEMQRQLGRTSAVGAVRCRQSGACDCRRVAGYGRGWAAEIYIRPHARFLHWRTVRHRRRQSCKGRRACSKERRRL